MKLDLPVIGLKKMQVFFERGPKIQSYSFFIVKINEENETGLTIAARLFENAIFLLKKS